MHWWWVDARVGFEREPAVRRREARGWTEESEESEIEMSESELPSEEVASLPAELRRRCLWFLGC